MLRKYCALLMAITVLIACNMTSNLNSTPTPTNTPPPAPSETPALTATATVTPSATRQPATAFPTAQLPPACNPRTDWLLYSVVAGDTLGTIAAQVNSTVNELAVANCLANPNAISVGQQLRVPRLPQQIPTPYDQTPRILTFIRTSSYPPMLEWRTENVGEVLIYVSDSMGENRLYGVFGPNASAPAPTTTGVATYRLTIRDKSGKDVIGPNGLPVYAIAQTSGGGNGGSELDCPSASNFGSGIVDVTPIDASWSRCLFVNSNQLVTLSWTDMPQSIQRIEYYFIPMVGACNGAALGNPNVVTSDLNTADGTSATWFVGLEPCAGVLYAFGYPPTGLIESQQRPFVIR